MLHSLSWGLGKYYKERGKIWGKKLYFLTSLYHLFHLSSHLQLSLPFHSSAFFFAFYPSPTLFCFVCCGSSYELQMLLWRFHKELRFQPLSRRMALGGSSGGGDISKVAFSCRSCTPTPILFFIHTALLHPLIP